MTVSALMAWASARYGASSDEVRRDLAGWFRLYVKEKAKASPGTVRHAKQAHAGRTEGDGCDYPASPSFQGPYRRF